MAALWVLGSLGAVALVGYLGLVGYFLWTGRDVEPDHPSLW